GGRDCVPGLRRRALDHRCEHSGRRWVKALGGEIRCGYVRDELSGVACARRRGGSVMSQTKQERNKALVLEAFDTLVNKRDYVAAQRYWSPHYIQHSAHIAPGREGLFELVKAAPSTLKYEPGLVVAEGDFVILHGRFSRLRCRSAESWWTSSGSRAASWLSTGTSSRTRRLRSNPRAEGPCSVSRSPFTGERRSWVTNGSPFHEQFGCQPQSSLPPEEQFKRCRAKSWSPARRGTPAGRRSTNCWPAATRSGRWPTGRMTGRRGSRNGVSRSSTAICSTSARSVPR